MAVFELNGKRTISSERAPSVRMKACANYPKGAPRSLSERLAQFRDTIFCYIWLNSFLFFFFLEEGMRNSFPVGKGLAGGDRMILVIENFNLTE